MKTIQTSGRRCRNLVRHCRGISAGSLMLLTTCVISTAEPPSDSVHDALAEVLGEDRTADSAWSVCERAGRLSDDRRFRFLKSHVLPTGRGSGIRLSMDFSPTNPAPVFRAKSLVSGKHRAPRGSVLVSPSHELIRTAAQLEKLNELRTVIESIRVAGPNQLSGEHQAELQKSRAALLCGVEAAAGNLAAAEQHLRALTDLARTVPGNTLERAPEVLGLWEAAEYPELRSSAEELAVVLFEEIRHGNTPRSERYKRLITAKRQTLAAPVAASSDFAAQSEWISVSRMIAETRGAGYPHAEWELQPGLAFHRAGHDHDYLYYRSPLTGEFAVETDSSAFGLRDIQLGYAGEWSGPAWDLKSVVNAGFRYDQPALPLVPPLTRMLDTMRLRLEVSRNEARLLVNGRLIQTREISEGTDPWLSIHSWWLAHGTVRNVRITGNPVIPQTISLVTPNLIGWQPYFDESAGWQNADWFSRPVDSSAEQPDLLPPSVVRSNAEYEIVSRLRRDRVHTFSESLLRYHRPMAEDGKIAYEFFYEPDKTLVHPALDRLCLILQPSGVSIHWATDGRHDPTETGPDNLFPATEDREGSGALPLMAGEWNLAELSLDGDVLTLRLNGQFVYSRALEPENLRTFGLFHWADQSQVQVRRLKWTGRWPGTIPDAPQQFLADYSAERQLGDRNTLQQVVSHDFRNGIPRQLMSFAGAGWEQNVQQSAEGIRITRSGGEYVNYTLLSPISLIGDFDIIAEFDEFRAEVEPGGEGNIQLAALIDDDHASECYLFRKYYVFSDNRQEQVAQAAIFQKRGGETQFSFFDAPPAEMSRGRMRLVRRGTTLFFLMAEPNSENYRLIRREMVTRDEARFRFVVGHHKHGATSVLLRSLDVRAEAAWGASGERLKSIAELDTERAALPDRKVWDFRSMPNGSAALRDFSLFGGTTGQYTPEAQGLRIAVPGTENWTAAGLLAPCRIEGDFDILLALETLNFEPCKLYDESCVLLLAEFRDARKTTIETKFSIHNQGDTRAETQYRRLRRDGQFEYQELVTESSPDATVLRLARRGDIVYQVFQNSRQKEPVVLGAVKIGHDPVIPGDLRALIHTGGQGRSTSVRFHSLTIHAEKISQPGQN